MTAKLRTIRKFRRASTVTRRDVTAAVKAVMASRDEATQRLVEGKTNRKSAVAAGRK